MADDFADVRHKGCLLLMVQERGSDKMEILPIAPGADLWLTEELGNDAVTFPYILSKVSRKFIEFKCGCRNRGCNRTVRYAVKVHGSHPQKESGGVTVKSPGN